jgi:hypothetical protein
MAVDRRDAEERDARIALMMEQYSAAQNRRMIRRGMALWRHAEALLQAQTYGAPLRREKIH